MALSINTNIASLQAQNNLNQVNKALQQNQERLASGLRINTAADDAAGMAISDRMTAQIRGLNQAVRNANDAISVTNTAEGALQETTDILQRMRELAVQSSNDSNTASDRASIQDEVNQLKQEIDRIATNTDFNGTKLLDGTFTTKNFQVGNNADQTISLSVASAQGKDLGNYTVQSNNVSSLGLSAATRVEEATADGAGLGDVSTGGSYTAAQQAAVTDQTITVTQADGTTDSFSIDADAERAADQIAAGLSSVGGVADASAAAHSVGYNIDATALNTGNNTVSFDIHDSGDSANLSFTVNGTSPSDLYQAMKTEIDADTDLNFAVESSASGLTLTSSDGQNIGIGNVNVTTQGGGAATKAFTLGSQAIANGSNYAVKVSTVSVELENGASIQSDATQANSIFNTAQNTDVETTAVGVNNISAKNNVESQQLTVTGPEGSATGISVPENSSAFSIAQSVNDVSGDTGVTAKAETSLTIDNLTGSGSITSGDGTITFNLYGSNEDVREISATVTESNLQPLVDAINDQTGATGVVAELAGDGESMTLSNSEGYDIKIENFEHSSASADSSMSLDVTGGDGTSVTLSDSGNNAADNDSTVVGGTVTFQSTGDFSVRSTLAADEGGIFTGDSNEAQVGDMDELSQVDVSTYDGAQNAIETIDAAIQQVDDIRGELGAKTNRFDSTINNLNNVIQNVTSARQQIRDADIAKEAAEMTQNNVRQQASASVLTQANQTPQLALQLMGG